MNPITRLYENPWRVAVALGCALGVFTASVMPTPSRSLVPIRLPGVVGLDKWVHAAGYASLSFVFASAVRVRGRDEVMVAILAAGIFGAGIELVQAMLPYRSFGAAGAGVNLVGTVLGGVARVAAIQVADTRG